MRVKRRNLVLDERLLAEALQVLGAKTSSAAVNTALEEVIRLRKIQSIPHFFGSGIWQDGLSQMREDRPPGILRVRAP
jgi:predicted TIM-barrel enzyme